MGDFNDSVFTSISFDLVLALFGQGFEDRIRTGLGEILGSHMSSLYIGAQSLCVAAQKGKNSKIFLTTDKTG
jgi:hypothetical protein